MAFGAALLTVIAGMLAGRGGSRRLAELSHHGVLLQFGLIGVASAVLLYGFVTHDFALQYVYGRSAVRMPLLYTVTAFWGGQEGSLLLWVTVTSSLAAGAAWVNRGRLPEIMPYFHAVVSAVVLGFLSILNFVTNPFDTWLVIDAPVDGQGLNPLLQTPLMAIHPPCLLAGFASFAIPFAFGAAALLARQHDSEWLKATRRWTLVSWMFLSVGNILGGMWAYQELGWGGYWAWDPVENAALIPWLTASALLHSVIIQEQRGMLKRWNAVLVSLTFLLTLLGTWMTRSGLIESVHTFAESDVGHYFLALLVSFTLFSAYLLVTRWKGLRSDRRIESAVSREGAFLFNNWALVGLAFVVLWGTLFPKFKEMLTGDQVSIGPTWFNRYAAPFGLVLLLVMALGTVLPWRRATRAALLRIFGAVELYALITTAAVVAGWWFLRGVALGANPFTTAGALSIVGAYLIVLNLWIVGREFVRGLRARRRTEDNAVDGLMSLFSRHRRRYGGYLVHIGILFVFLAFLGNAVKVDVDATLLPGDVVQLGDYELSYDDLRVEERRDRREFHADMTLDRNGRTVDTLHPARYDFNDYAMLAGGRPDPMKITSEIYIRSTPLEDVYVALLNFDPDTHAAAFKLVVLPFTWWFWFGGLVLVAGTLICLWPERDLLQPVSRGRRVLRTLEVGGLVVALVVPAVMFIAPMEAWADEGEHVDLNGMLSPEQRQLTHELEGMIMTTCSGCAGKTLATASPSCAPSNEDRARIREMVAAGLSRDAVLDAFVAERGEATLAVPRGGTSQAVPIALFAIAGVAVAGVVRRMTGSTASSAAASETGDAPGDDAYLDRFRDELAAME